MTNLGNKTAVDARNPLNFVREGMSVYDLNEKRIGLVETVFLGGASDEAIQMGKPAATSPDVDLNRQPSLFENVVNVFVNDPDVPVELQERLLHDGYVRINIQGLLGLSRFVFPDQIAYVSEEGLVLSVPEEDLLKV